MKRNWRLKNIKTNDYKKDFLKVFNSFSEKYSRFTVWSDFIHASGYAISNAFDYRQEREDKYLKIMERYSKEEINKFPELLALTTSALESNRKQDFLGQIYMESGFGNEKNGEYFTSYEIAELMARIAETDIDDFKSKDYVAVNDCTCGSGVMLIAYANYLSESEMNHSLKLLTVANDCNSCIALMCYIQTSLLGCAGYVTIRNALTEPLTGNPIYPPDDAFLTPLFFHPVWMLRRSFDSLKEAN